MKVFAGFLVIGWIVLAVYTAAVIGNHGVNFLPVFFAGIASVDWSGQFNIDFVLMLSLAAVWIAWRHKFSLGGLALAALALFGGAGFMYPYLLAALMRSGGDPRLVLLGKNSPSNAGRNTSVII